MESPQHDSEPDGVPPQPADGSLDGAPPQPGPSLDPPASEPPSGAGAVEYTSSSDSRPDRLGRFKLALGRRGFWAGVAVLCVAVGALASVLGARAVARNDAAEARQAFPRTAAGIASTLKLTLQHEEDLIISGSTFFAGKPDASAMEFNTWVKWAQALRRYPELQKLGLVALVRAPELPAFEARVTGHAAKATQLPARLGQRSPALARGGLHIVPAGGRSFNCLAAVELARQAAKHAQPGLDYCAVTPGLLPSRDSGVSVYESASAGHSQGLAIETPVYRGNVPPSSLTSRREAFVGWLREVLVPATMLQQVLRGHPQYAVRLRRRTGSSNIIFSSGATQPGAQSSAVNLHNGWTVRTSGPAPAAVDLLTDGDSLALLIVGCLLSLLLGLLVFVLGGRRGPAPVRKVRALPHADLYDAVTGLPNRALMMDRAERMLARAGRQSGLLVGALFVDIDWFRDVNEKLGREAGDQLLAIVGERLEGVVRAHDTVGRLGGDEFVVLVETAARGARLDSLARRMIEALHKPVELDGFGPGVNLTASIGVAFGRYATPDDLLRDAKLALYAARSAGRDRYTLFNANMRSVIEGRGVLEAELNTALVEQQFFLLYQPIYDLRTRRAVGLEALIRWQHPTQGELPPDDFIPLAEESGLIVPIGRWVLGEACARAAAWNVAGHRVGISVKVSATQLNRDGFITDVRRALQQSGIEPELLTLEIAEATAIRDVAAATARLQEVKELGVRIAIDDFGSGYAIHADLQSMPLDFLKVDRSALATSDDEAYASWLLQTIIVLGRDLSIPVIATEIETYEEMTTLQAMGCAMAQGFFLGRPTPADAVASVLNVELQVSPTASTTSVPG
ncbi:MAG TPA: EAL domain-containing protein [Solirubrobacteraceae bacterium]|jgi:diguanylate cyclase (GGDEF)-like protein|nr:EAL domain-containing protein [Solirubrobacteraceae bacterium]